MSSKFFLPADAQARLDMHTQRMADSKALQHDVDASRNVPADDERGGSPGPVTDKTTHRNADSEHTGG